MGVISGESKAVADLLSGLICDLIVVYAILNIRAALRNLWQLRQAR